MAAAGCGGGGGGGGDDSGSVSSFRLSDTAVPFSGYLGGNTPAGKSVRLTVETTRTVYVDVSYDGPAVVNAQLFVEDAAAGIASIEITPAPTNGSGMTEGTNTGTVTVRGCYDVYCAQEIPQSPLVIDVSYDLKRFADQDELRFDAVEGGAAPASQTVHLALGAGETGNWDSGIDYLMGSGWLHLDKSSGSSLPDQISFSVDPLPVGVYQADVALATHAANGITHSVLVTYVVAGTLGTSTSPRFDIARSSTAADGSKTVTVVSNDPATPAIDWSASVDVPWLSLSPASGNTVGSNQLTVSLVGAEMKGLQNRYTTGDLIKHKGNITLSAVGYSSVTVPVVLTLDLATVNVVSPNAVVAGSSTELVLRGRGFTGATGVSFGGASVAVTSRNDTEIRVNLPALTPGDYVVSISNDLGIVRNDATLHVIPAAFYGEQSMTRSGRKRSIVYDPVGKAIFVANAGSAAIDKYTFNEGTGAWDLTSVALASLDKLALAIDGSYILATTTSGSGIVHEIDPADLHTVFTLGVGSRIGSLGFDNLNEAVLAPSEAGIPSDVLRLPRDSAMGILGPQLEKPVVGVCGDGRRVLVGTPGGSDFIYFFDVGNAQNIYPMDMKPSPSRLGVTSITGDRTGSKWLLNLVRVYDKNLAYRYSLPATTVASVLSPGGGVAYSVDSNGKLRKFKLGSGLTDAGQTTLPASPGSNPIMTISGDGQSLFIAGDQRVIVMPAP